ncbi:MAG: PP2C family protein-serine/threonine phosphatase [Bacteroidota bacterium]
MKNFKSVYLYLVLLLAAVPIAIKLFPLASFNGSIQLPYDVNAITAIAKSTLDSLSIDVSNLRENSQFKTDKKLLRQVQQENGVERANDLIRNGLPVYYWELSWKKKQQNIFGVMKTEEDKTKELSNLSAFLRGDINIHFTEDGKLLSFEREIPDTLKLPVVDHVEARMIADEFLKRFTPYRLPQKLSPVPGSARSDSNGVSGKSAASIIISPDERRIEQKQRIDYEYSIFTASRALNDSMEIKIRVAGNTISKFSIEYHVPDKYIESDSVTYHELIIALVYIVLAILLIVAAFKRIRAYEIGFRGAWIVGIVVTISSAIDVLISTPTLLGLDLLVPLILGPLFYGGVMVVLWGIVESVGRETMGDNFISLDLIRNGHFAHSRIGMNVIRGISIGMLGIAIRLLLTWICNKATPLWNHISDDAAIMPFQMQSPALFSLNHILFETLFVFAFFILFVVPLVRSRVKSPVLAIAIATIIIELYNVEGTQPLAIGIAISAIAAVALVWVVFYFDVLAGYVGLFTAYACRQALTLYYSGDGFYINSAWWIAGLFGAALIFAVALLFRKKEITDFDEIAPAFAKHISERQRLQQELEIARNVQMSLLPKSSPFFTGLDIACRCVPAKEIGGDYYDFILLDDDKLGIALGDVSGKGTQAAFFMTLTKGFLRALVKVSHSPAEVLTQVNRLFYENVERGVFISMLYAVFHKKEKLLKLARAGQNPVIRYNARLKQIDYLKQNGLALGLDPTEKFSEVIQEVGITYEPGDVFVFYTDGFPEAMNKKLEEYGDERFSGLITRNAHLSAEEIIEVIFKEMKHFSGSANQHDDMTIVVVKVV